MSAIEIEQQLEQLCNASEDLLLCMVVSTDGLVIAHHGTVSDPDVFGAYFFELKVVCEKIITSLDCDGVSEIYIRSRNSAVTLFPINGQGYLACLSSARINAGKVQMLAWKYVHKINGLF